MRDRKEHEMTRDPLGGGERCSQDWRATEPYCNSVTPDTGCHHQDPHFHRAIFLTQRLNTQENLAQMLMRTHMSFTEALFSLRAGGGHGELRSGEHRAAHSLCPPACCSPAPGPHHSPDRRPAVGNPVSQDLVMTLLMTCPEGASSPPRDVEVIPRAKTVPLTSCWGLCPGGQCCPVLAWLLCTCPPSSRLGGLLWG